MSASPESLTPSGWPRPRVDGWPVPWVSPSEDLSRMNTGRYQACASGAVCAVCGEGYEPDERAWALVSTDERGGDETPPVGPLPPGSEVMPMDNATLHPRCLRLAYTTCPALLRLRERGELYLVEVPANAADVVLVPDSDEPDARVTARSAYAGEGCVVLPRDAGDVLAPFQLWQQANRAGGTREEVEGRYRDLLRDHGHLTERPAPTRED